jgi:hypothetical protein
LCAYFKQALQDKLRFLFVLVPLTQKCLRVFHKDDYFSINLTDIIDLARFHEVIRMETEEGASK